MRTSTCPPNDNNINEDSLSKVLGPEKRGAVKDLGFGVIPSHLNAQIQSAGRVKQLEGKLKVATDKLVSLEERMNAMMKQNEHVIYDVYTLKK